jgi:hypothetical protein
VELDKIFNVNRSMFFDRDSEGRVSGRGKYLAEFTPERYDQIVGCSLSGLKKKDLTWLPEAFPSLVKVTIEKTSNITSLNGLGIFTALHELRIENCPKLVDFSALESCQALKNFNSEKIEHEIKVLQFVSRDVEELYLGSNVVDLSMIAEFGKLSALSLAGHESDAEELPDMPSVSTSFGLEGFKKLKSAKFLTNLSPEVRIRWWGPKPIAEVPAHLNADLFK